MNKKYEVYTTEEFDKDFEKLDKSLKEQIDNEIEQLKTNPYVGKPLGYKFFREKRVKGGHRFYFLIYDEYVVVFVVAISDKKDQQNVIDTIKTLIPFYREEIKKKLNL
ncbi:MAG: type II toxin-antitoxin system RelE/ParE family toxin [Nanoarchaeota archaeon]